MVQTVWEIIVKRSEISGSDIVRIVSETVRNFYKRVSDKRRRGFRQLGNSVRKASERIRKVSKRFILISAGFVHVNLKG